MKLSKYIAFALLLGLSSQGFAQKSDEGWMKRNWNNMIARYNIYFNATQKLDAAVNNLAEKQKDDFEKYLSVYPYGNKSDIKAMKTPMEEVMKKASKVIQNKPKSKWADDAYFIIGQTHFFSGDYFSAIETFEFVNANYTDPYIKEMSQLWLMKSYAMQGKDNDAEAILGLLKDIKTPNKEFNTHLALSAGDLMIKQAKYPEAIDYLKKGIGKVKDKTLKYRSNFVLGQLYLETEKYKDASYHFERVLKMNAPYEYVFQANLGMAKATSKTGGQGAKSTKKYLKRMLNDDKNIEYYDQIYYELGSIEFASGNEQTGLDYMLLSSANSKNNRTQSTKTYLYLADHFFGNRNYAKAQAYYDSTVAVLPGDFPDGKKIKAKHSVLSKLIEHIETIKLQDSLLTLSRMDRDELDKKITKIIEEEKEKKRLAEEAALIQAEQQRLNPNGGMPQLPNGGNT
ncbi:MAG: tetratricopeptide repeat protein, partial [Bacteroidia bacterium]|nr:tetratricopeptide repeat protein [Bacteroidia bacterium]